MLHSIGDSSFVSSFEWLDGKLTVQLTNGNKYEYDKVPEQTYRNMIESKSKGAFFSSVIRNKFKHKVL